MTLRAAEGDRDRYEPESGHHLHAENRSVSECSVADSIDSVECGIHRGIEAD